MNSKNYYLRTLKKRIIVATNILGQKNSETANSQKFSGERRTCRFISGKLYVFFLTLRRYYENGSREREREKESEDVVHTAALPYRYLCGSPTSNSTSVSIPSSMYLSPFFYLSINLPSYCIADTATFICRTL